MSIVTFPLDVTDYSADALGAWFAARTRGVFAADGHYHITTNDNMSVTVSPGLAWLKMAEHWGVVAFNREPTTLAVQQAENTLQRVDVICLQLDKVANTSRLLIRRGEPGLDSPAPPVRDSNVDEIYLATITVPAGAAAVQAVHITDRRLDEFYCGIMSDGTKIPTQQLYDIWMAWFADIKGILDGDALGNLFNRITALERTMEHTLEEVAEALERKDGVIASLHKLLPKRLAMTILASGTFRPADYGLDGAAVDIYLVGGGGGGANVNNPAGGGGGGVCKLIRDVTLDQPSYAVVIGAGGAGPATSNTPGVAGGTTSGFGVYAEGGFGAQSGNGGSGGSGGGGGFMGNSVGTYETGGIGGDQGGGGGGNLGGAGSGNVEFTPVNPYDGIAYGSGGGGNGQRGGGAGGRVGQDGFLGGGGGGNLTRGSVRSAGNGGLGGGGGGGAETAGSTTGTPGRGGDGLIYLYAAPRLDAAPTLPVLGGLAQVSEDVPMAFAGDLSPMEIFICESAMKKSAVRVGVLRDGVCVDTAVFRFLEEAEAFLEKGLWPGADEVVMLQDTVLVLENAEEDRVALAENAAVWIDEERAETV